MSSLQKPVLSGNLIILQGIMATKIILEGIVQGVGCRGYCSRYARKYNLHGSATNLGNGSVCIIINTDDEETINTYMNSLIQNPDRITFFGRITGYRLTTHNGRIEGDYNF